MSSLMSLNYTLNDYTHKVNDYTVMKLKFDMNRKDNYIENDV